MNKNNQQFRAIPSSSSRALEISSNGDNSIAVDSSSNKFPIRDCGSSNSTSTNEDSHEYQDGALQEETINTEEEETETYSNLDLNTVKLFVGQIPYSYGEENLYPLFSQFGPVAEIVVIRDRFTYKSRGCAFVSFRNKKDADSCIRELNQRLKLPPLNTPLRVKYAYTEQQLDTTNENVNNAPNLTTSSSPNDQSSENSQDLTLASNFLSCLNIDKYEIGVPHPDNKLFIRNIPKNVTEDELSTLFESFGEILDVVVLRTTIHTSKGCGFVKFVNQEAADMVINTFKREIMNPIQEYQQGAQQEGSTLGGPSNQRLVELTNKLLESSFLMKGAITPLLVRYADNEYTNQVPLDGNEQIYPYTTQYGSYQDPSMVNTYGFNNQRRRKSYPPFSHHSNSNRRGGVGGGGGSYHPSLQNYYHNPYYDHTTNHHHTNGGGSGYTLAHHHGAGLYPHNYYYPPQTVAQEGGTPLHSDTVYYYHLYNNPYASSATGAPNLVNGGTTTTITAPLNDESSSSSIKANGNTENSSGPTPVPPMYYYYNQLPYYYPPHQYAAAAASSGNSTSNTSTNNNGNHGYSSKYSSQHITNGRKQRNDRKSNQDLVTKCSDA